MSRRALRGRWDYLLAAAALLGLGFYLLWALSLHGPGFPLDDAWIHQTYARNLVERGEWAFLPGEPSAGSTSPLWSLLQTGGQLMGLHPVAWSGLLGVVSLSFLGLLVARWWRKRVKGPHWHAALVALVVIWEWHLLWASLSGMEILAVAVVAVGSFLLLERPEVPWLWLGGLIGVGMWLRPDVLSLLLPAGWVLAVRSSSWRDKLRGSAALGTGLAALVLPYLLFNQLLSGTIWPTTFYAKQTEYRILSQSSLVSRLGAQFAQPLIGAGAVLAPGLALELYRRMRGLRWDELAPFVWIGGFLTAYALRLPVTYQHGRYAMPVIAVVLILSMEGMYGVLRPHAEDMIPRVLSRAWVLAAGGATLAFAVLGARAYAADVAIIETEMVRTAKWIEANTEKEALIAAHDIGALGYYGERRILDLAGLVSPEVIGFMRDESALADHLDRRGADYLMTFPGWYPQLVRPADRVYTTQGVYSPAAGGENMVVYRWRR